MVKSVHPVATTLILWCVFRHYDGDIIKPQRKRNKFTELLRIRYGSEMFFAELLIRNRKEREGELQ